MLEHIFTNRQFVQNFGLLDDAPCNSQPLPLATRKLQPCITDRCLVALEDASIMVHEGQEVIWERISGDNSIKL